MSTVELVELGVTATWLLVTFTSVFRQRCNTRVSAADLARTLAERFSDVLAKYLFLDLEATLAISKMAVNVNVPTGS